MTRVADASMNVAPPNLDTPGAGKVGQNRSGLPVQLSNLRQWNPARPGTPALDADRRVPTRAASGA